MNNQKILEEEISTLLASFQSIYFGISEHAVMSELDRKAPGYDRIEASRLYKQYQPLVRKILDEVSRYQLPILNGLYTEDSFNIELLARDFASQYPNTNQEYIKKIARMIVYWRYRR